MSDDVRNEYDPRHPHERDEYAAFPIAPVFDDDGRCLVCALAVARDQTLEADDPHRPVMVTAKVYEHLVTIATGHMLSLEAIGELADTFGMPDKPATPWSGGGAAT